MDLSSILLAIILLLGATAICVSLFQRLGFGSVLGLIVAGIVIGPHTPGPVLSEDVEGLQGVAELGVVLFLFVVGLEMRPEKVWAMRRLLFGLGSLQMLATAAALAAYAGFVVGHSWQSAVVLGLGLAMSSTAIIMTTLQERGALASEHGQSAFAVLMAQDLWIVPVMALVPILGTRMAPDQTTPLWQEALLVVGVIGGIFVVGRYLLPFALGYAARMRRAEVFGIFLLLAVIAAAWAVEHAGISMTLGAFLMGMLLSASDYRYQIEAIVAPFKDTLMGLFFISVGMSIEVGSLLESWDTLLVHVPVLLVVKAAVLIALALAFGIGRAAAIRTGFYLSQSGEFAFVLLGAAAAAGLLSDGGLTLAMLVVAVTMILTPLMVKLGDRLAGKLQAAPAGPQAEPPCDLKRHVVVVGYDEVGQLVCQMLEKANIPYVAFDRDVDAVRQGKRTGRNVHYGDMSIPSAQEAAGLGQAAAACVTTSDMHDAKALAVTLHRLHPGLKVYVRVRTMADQDELVAKGITHARTGYIESTLATGSLLLKDLGVSEDDVGELIKSFQQDNYALVRAGHAGEA